MKDRQRNVASQIVEKLLVNLRVIAQLQEGDKMDYNAQGQFIPQKPDVWTSALRFFKRTDRWYTLNKIQETINSAEIMQDHDNGVDKERICKALKLCVHGLRNIQLTYQDDVLFYQNIEVLLERLQNRYALQVKEMI